MQGNVIYLDTQGDIERICQVHSCMPSEEHSFHQAERSTDRLD